MRYPAPLTDWLTTLATALEQGTFVKATLTLPTPSAAPLKSVDIRPILIKRELKLSFTYHNKTNDIVKNYTMPEAEPILAKLLNQSLQSGKIFALDANSTLTLKGKQFTLTQGKPTQTEAPSLTHDRTKNRVLESTNKPYLHSLGLTDAKGEILKSGQDKFRQINKFLEIIDGLLARRATEREQVPTQKTLRVMDMGSGKGYLTFALYDHLTTTLSLKAEVTGIEYREDMVKLCNNIAHTHNLSGLTFQQGTIADADCQNTNVVIALHACDTATDDALARAVKAGADLIVVAPCCHKQVRRNLKTPANHPLHLLLQYGTYEEKMAEMLTDTLRAHILQMHGYTTNVFEFIGGEHTPKNVMITAIRNPNPPTPEQKAKLNEALQALKHNVNLSRHALEDLLNTTQ